MQVSETASTVDNWRKASSSQRAAGARRPAESSSERSRLRALGALSELKRARPIRPEAVAASARSACASSSSSSAASAKWRPARTSDCCGTGKLRLDTRHHLMPQVVPAVAPIAIALVFDPGQRVLLCVSAITAPGTSSKRTNQPRAAALSPFGRHSSRATDPGAAQQSQQYRLGLIVAMMRQRQPVCRTTVKHRMPQAARGGFQSFGAAMRHLDANDFKRYAATLAKIATESSPGVGTGTQAMVNMHRRQFESRARRAQRRERVQQNQRVATAGKTDAQACCRVTRVRGMPRASAGSAGWLAGWATQRCACSLTRP
jgi:hypothetical protein